jgi:hypothetical protein
VTLEHLIQSLIREAVQQELRALTIAGVSGSPANDLDRSSDSPMTTAQAARYCGFKTTAAIRKALLDGRLVPLGRRGGTGTYMWSRQALDAFVAGARGGIVPLGRPGAPPTNIGGHHGRNEVGTEVEILDRVEALATGGVALERRWLPDSRSRDGLSDRKTTRDSENGKGHGHGRRVQAFAGSPRRGSQRAESDGSADALQRIRRIAVRKKGAQG